VRARQERVPFVTLEDRDIIASQVLPLLGQQVALVASPEGVQLRPATATESAATSASSSNGNGSKAAQASSNNGVDSATWSLAVSKVSKPGVVALLDCTASVGGAKAAACGRLEQVRWQQMDV
jgi:hypothetical protein